MKKFYLILTLLILTSCVSPEKREIDMIINAREGAVHVHAQLSITDEQRRKGLMERMSIPQDSGMLFIFPSERVETFWMKNTFIPLDMLFISQDNTIVHIEKNVPPCKNDPCPLYSSGTKVLYVLETNGGFADKHGIIEGNTILLPSPL